MSQPVSNTPILSLDRTVSLAAFADVVRGKQKIRVLPEAFARLAVSSARLQQCIDGRRVVYGVTTGFGPLADREVPPESIEALQRNLIYHLATGVGAPLRWEESRALLFARLMSILQGWSGASAPVVTLMVDVLNGDLAPYVPEKGTVGASGDLTPSAHMALALMGEGAFVSKTGAKEPAQAVLQAKGLEPYRLTLRDGLAMVNGVSAMAGIAAVNADGASRALQWSLALTVGHAEAMNGRSEAWHPAFGEARPHPGQVKAHQKLALFSSGSQRLDASRIASKTVSDGDAIIQQARSSQDAYSIRCAPQVLGAVWDMLDVHDRIVETEINAASDNPIFSADEPFAIHGGNFYGQHVAFASDALFNAVAKIAILSERQIARITDETLNEGLPAFLQPIKPGLQSGFMGAQVTASALLAEIRTLAIPASIQSISTNGANQDVVSMGTIAARKVRNALDDVFRILAIQLLCVAQAVDIRSEDGGGRFCETTSAITAFARKYSARLEQDRPLSDDIETLALAMREWHPV